MPPPRLTTALLMIDFQRDFCAAGGYSDRFAGLDWVTPIIAPARRLLEAARRAGHPGGPHARGLRARSVGLLAGEAEAEPQRRQRDRLARARWAAC